MHAAHEALLIGGGLGVVSILAGLASMRIGTPVLLVFLVLGMLAGEDGPGGIVFNDFRLTYLVGSVALAIILFSGGQKTTFAMVREGAAPAIAIATVGVVICAAMVGGVIMWASGLDWRLALLLGAELAPTDAAAVVSVLKGSQVKVPHKVLSVLELESGLNDPASVFLTLALTQSILNPAAFGAGDAAISFAREMLGGAAFGLGGGALMTAGIRSIRLERSLYSVLMLCGAVALFGLAQLADCSGFLAVYLAGLIVGNRGGDHAEMVGRGFDSFAWIAQVGLFVLLGLLVNPHDLKPLIWPALAVAAVLILLARPLAAAACLLPFRLGWRGTTFVAWVGLRGAVPIFLAMIPVIEGVPDALQGFSFVFVIVLASLIVQGWTVGPVARLLRL